MLLLILSNKKNRNKGVKAHNHRIENMALYLPEIPNDKEAE